MEFVEEAFERAGRRLLRSLQPKQPRDFVIVKLVHFFQPLRDRIFPKFVQVIFATAGSRKRASALYRSFGDAQDLY